MNGRPWNFTPEGTDSPAPEPQPEPQKPVPVLAPGMKVEFDIIHGRSVLGIHPLDRALLGISFGNFEQTHPYDTERHSRLWMPYARGGQS